MRSVVQGLDPRESWERYFRVEGEATAKGGHAFQRLLQLAETRDSGQVRRVGVLVEVPNSGAGARAPCPARAAFGRFELGLASALSSRAFIARAATARRPG